MKHKSWLILSSILLLGLVGNTGLATTHVHARRVHRAHYSQITCCQRRPVVTKIPANIYPKDLLYYTENGQTGVTRNYFSNRHVNLAMSKRYIKSVVKNEYSAINSARKSIHERPLIQNQNLVKLAKWRAKQAERHFTHYNQKGQPLAWTDAVKMHWGSYLYNRWNIGENMFYVGKLSQVHTNNGLAGYYFKDPWALADDNVFDSLNNDAASQWSHGENIMMPRHRYIGIGTYYRKSTRVLYVLVEFSTKKPVIHKK